MEHVLNMKSLIRGRIIKHHTFKDICFDVYAVYALPGKVKLKGRWVNLGFVESYPLDKASLVLPDLSGWLMLKDRNLKCYRNGEWVPIRTSDDEFRLPKPRLSR